MRTFLRTCLREPLVHFLLAGAALLAVYGAIAQPSPPPDNRIVIGSSAVSQLRNDLRARLGRLPTDAELRQAIEHSVDREVLFREARALGLGLEDPIVRRRLIQKMEFVLEDAAGLASPSNEQLEAFLAEHPDRYRRPPRTALTHVFVSPTETATPEREAESLLEQLRGPQSPDPATLGHPFAHGQRFGPRTRAAIAGVFGNVFAQQVVAQPVGTWELRHSPYGVHLVRVDEQLPGDLPDLSDIRAAVVADWAEAQRAHLRRQALADLRSNYDIDVSEAAEPSS